MRSVTAWFRRRLRRSQSIRPVAESPPHLDSVRPRSASARAAFPAGKFLTHPIGWIFTRQLGVPPIERAPPLFRLCAAEEGGRPLPRRKRHLPGEILCHRRRYQSIPLPSPSNRCGETDSAVNSSTIFRPAFAFAMPPARSRITTTGRPNCGVVLRRSPTRTSGIAAP